MPGRRNLQDQSVKVNAVVAAHRAFVLFAQDVVQAGADPRHEGRPLLHGGLGKLGVECRQIDLGKVLIGLGQARDASQRQFLRQAPLVRGVIQ
ncbi:hypothetical protein DSYM_07650 [Candidatus Desulfobacillus denitrificans]|uniref:Uncharacterized protein n=1 Tax=Candidatus Desulfobacillus denitrificans TaxID=2608985 RepID=A0A809RV48_9PROT|nr:hypothetical protein DSYM_07650 [Candidatus Desulfobacillus denitrificans]